MSLCLGRNNLYRLVENSHHLFGFNHLFLFLITIPTVTYHSNPQSLHLSCLCLLFHITLRYFMFYFSISSLLTRYRFIASYSFVPSFSSVTIPLHIECIQITHASLFQLVHTHSDHHHMSMSSFHFLSLTDIPLLPSGIFYLPFRVIRHILPCFSANLQYSLADVLL